jgi:hypothetical protein
MQVDERGRKCFVKFEDDSEYWILFKDLQKGKICLLPVIRFGGDNFQFEKYYKYRI